MMKTEQDVRAGEQRDATSNRRKAAHCAMTRMKDGTGITITRWPRRVRPAPLLLPLVRCGRLTLRFTRPNRR